MSVRWLLVSTVLVVLGPPSFADVGPTKLETLIEGADLVVTGKVINVTAASETFKIAEVRILQTLHGKTDKAMVRYIASPLFPDDVSDALPGETTLLFLRKLRKPPSEYPADIREITRGEPLFYLAHAGRGRLVPVRIDGDDYIYFRLGHGILLPPKLLALWKQDPKDSNLGSLRVNDLLGFIEHYTATKQRTDRSSRRMLRFSSHRANQVVLKRKTAFRRTLDSPNDCRAGDDRRPNQTDVQHDEPTFARRI